MSTKSKWYISKYRYLELKNMCLQYPEWKKELLVIDSGLYSFNFIKTDTDQVEFKDPTFRTVEKREELVNKIKAIEDTAKLSGEDLSAYILECVCLVNHMMFLKLHVEEDSSMNDTESFSGYLIKFRE